MASLLHSKLQFIPQCGLTDRGGSKRPSSDVQPSYKLVLLSSSIRFDFVLHIKSLITLGLFTKIAPNLMLKFSHDWSMH